MPVNKIRESRFSPAYPSYPGKIEYGCLHQTVRGGPLDRVFIESEDEAIRDVLGMREQGIKAVLVTREIPDWTERQMSVAELRDYVKTLDCLLEEERLLHAEQARLDEERRREEDGALGWKEL